MCGSRPLPEAVTRSTGTFAVLPDHTALGVQTANRIFDLADADFQLTAEDEVDLPLSTTTTSLRP